MIEQPALPLQWIHGSTVVSQPPAPGAQDSALQRWIGQLSFAVAQVAAGERPARQLFRVVSPSALDLLRRRAALQPSRNAPLRRTLSVRVARPSPDVAEATAVVLGARRVQAVALQLRRRPRGWHVTAIEIR